MSAKKPNKSAKNQPKRKTRNREEEPVKNVNTVPANGYYSEAKEIDRPGVIPCYAEPPRTAAAPIETRMSGAESVGRLASSVESRNPDWFLPDFLPTGCLVLVVGEPRTGKSSMGAWLCAMANRPAILPGNEEDVGTSLLPRLLAHKANLGDTIILDGRLWSFPHDRKAMLTALKDHMADILWIDPIDSYVGECSENDGQGVRAALECLATIARETPCLIVAARHPGKSKENICPGSRQWRAVPREIVELRREPGPPERRVLRCLRDPFSVKPEAKMYTLKGDDRRAPVFELGASVSDSAADTMGLGDVVDRWMIDEATEMLKAMLKDGEQPSTVVYKHGEDQRLRERTVRLAGRRLGVVIRREGTGVEHRSYWSLPVDSGTPAQ